MSDMQSPENTAVLFFEDTLMDEWIELNYIPAGQWGNQDFE